MLSIQNIRVEYGARVLFQDLSFSISSKERIALAGHNGAGKSTLLKCIAGVIEPSSGTITHAKGYSIGYLPQEGIHISGISLWDETNKAFSAVHALEEEVQELSARLEKLDPKDPLYSKCLEQIGGVELRLEHYEPNRIKPKVSAVLLALGFTQEDFSRDCSEFSGGWQMRIAMAKLFLSEPDCLLLDEPTNHLDLPSQVWMEQYLKNYSGAVILISHDLALLDTLTTRTIAFHHGRAEEYAGNYSFYLKESALRKELLLKQYKSQQREIQKTKDFINRFRAKATKAAQVQSRIKQLEKIELIELEDDDATMDFSFPPPPPSAHRVALLEEVSKSFEALSVFPPYSLEITQGQKMAIVGSNGSGKSTFCRLLMGHEQPSFGNLTLGSKTLPSFFSQTHADELDPNATVLETVEAAASREARPQARTLLGCFLFKGDDVFKTIGMLSGGERSRVALISMLLRPANFLILDEPTNHLDLQSQTVLQKALQRYPGTVIIVSHNRSFLDPLVEQTLEFRLGKSPRLFHGNISYYLEKTDEYHANSSSRPPSKPSSSSASSALASAPALNAKARRQKEALLRKQRQNKLKPLQTKLQELEERIAEFEAAQHTLTNHLNQPETMSDHQALQETTHAYQSITQQLEQAYTSWTAISEQIEILEQKFGS